jgi:hypothetical protein
MVGVEGVGICQEEQRQAKANLSIASRAKIVTTEGVPFSLSMRVKVFRALSRALSVTL